VNQGERQQVNAERSQALWVGVAGVGVYVTFMQPQPTSKITKHKSKQTKSIPSSLKKFTRTLHSFDVSEQIIYYSRHHFDHIIKKKLAPTTLVKFYHFSSSIFDEV
jgi:short-subunit dehydrogenase